MAENQVNFRQHVDNFYAFKGLYANSTIEKKITLLKNYLGFTHYFCEGMDSMTPKEIEEAELGALEFALLELS